MTEEINKKLIYMATHITKNYRSFRLAILTIVQGIWLFHSPLILRRYLIYELLEDIVTAEMIAFAFVFIGLGSIIGILMNQKAVKNSFAVLSTVLWSTWTISFFVTPPPNSIWIVSGFVVYLSYEAIWADAG